MYRLALLLLLTQPPLKFEVASIKPATMRPAAGGRDGGAMSCPAATKIDGGRAEFDCASLVNLISYAYGVSSARIQGPDWIARTRFDVAAKLPDGASQKQAPEMLQSLLAERFHLAVHRAAVTRTMYALTIAKGGLKMTATVSPESETTEETSDAGHTQRWKSGSISAASLADLVDRQLPLDAPVVDMTGLKGRYRMVLEVVLKDLPGFRAPMEMENAVLARFNEGLGKLGLQLERRKGPVDIIVVDRVDRAPSGN